jgi:hypothetical protein
MVDKPELALEELIEERFSAGTKIIHPAFPAYLKLARRSNSNVEQMGGI